MINETRATFNDFIKIDDHVRQIGEEPWSLYWGEMSGSEFEKFSRDPQGVLKDHGVNAEGCRFQILNLNANASRYGAAHIVCSSHFVMPDERAVFVVTFCHPG